MAKTVISATQTSASSPPPATQKSDNPQLQNHARKNPKEPQGKKARKRKAEVKATPDTTEKNLEETSGKKTKKARTKMKADSDQSDYDKAFLPITPVDLQVLTDTDLAPATSPTPIPRQAGKTKATKKKALRATTSTQEALIPILTLTLAPKPYSLSVPTNQNNSDSEDSEDKLDKKPAVVSSTDSSSEESSDKEIDVDEKETTKEKPEKDDKILFNLSNKSDITPFLKELLKQATPKQKAGKATIG
ncbi:hypothetical protein NP233_g8521 [Leucocoprinus birnbaumii]|uniref:Uncharacterized protein n=1 Tax=Leucocoprinus birnbaumii TaxID=56174 RepID=A0AAD5VPM3_9AGAR|nr:hypothetical protein NP233_g8521 [Leucocoprinus birnbaumii]